MSQDFKVGSQTQLFYTLWRLRQSAIRVSDLVLLQQRNPRLESCPTNPLLSDNIRQNHFGKRLLVWSNPAIFVYHCQSGVSPVHQSLRKLIAFYPCLLEDIAWSLLDSYHLQSAKSHTYHIAKITYVKTWLTLGKNVDETRRRHRKWSSSRLIVVLAVFVVAQGSFLGFLEGLTACRLTDPWRVLAAKIEKWKVVYIALTRS